MDLVKNKLFSGFFLWVFLIGFVDVFKTITGLKPPTDINISLLVVVLALIVTLPQIPSFAQIKKWVQIQ